MLQKFLGLPWVALGVDRYEIREINYCTCPIFLTFTWKTLHIESKFFLKKDLSIERFEQAKLVILK